MMWQNYFEYNGEKYYTGTVFVVRRMGSNVDATFVCYDVQKSWYVYKVGVATIYSTDNMFWSNFVSLTNRVNLNTHVPTLKKRKELDIDGMSIGWTWYIVLMLISSIFKDAVGLWAVISIVFFTWRHEKINKEGTYIEW